MAADPRGHRRFRVVRAVLIAAAQGRHRAGCVIPCRLCGKPLDPFQPYRLPGGKLNPKAPTVEHITALSSGGALLDPTNLDLAHRKCQSSQGATIANGRRREARTPNRPRSRRW